MSCAHEDVDIKDNGRGTCKRCGATSEVGMAWTSKYLVFDCSVDGKPLGKRLESIEATSTGEAASKRVVLYEKSFGSMYSGYVRVVPPHRCRNVPSKSCQRSEEDGRVEVMSTTKKPDAYISDITGEPIKDLVFTPVANTTSCYNSMVQDQMAPIGLSVGTYSDKFFNALPLRFFGVGREITFPPKQNEKPLIPHDFTDPYLPRHCCRCGRPKDPLSKGVFLDVKSSPNCDEVPLLRDQLIKVVEAYIALASVEKKGVSHSTPTRRSIEDLTSFYSRGCPSPMRTSSFSLVGGPQKR